MIIAVNTRLLRGEIHGGIEWFTYEILSRLVRDHPADRFIFIFDRKYSPRFIFGDNVEPVVTGPPARHPLSWHLWNQHMIPPVLKKFNASIYVSPDGMVPLGISTPVIPVIHDIAFHHRPDDIPFLKSVFYRRFYPRYAREGARIMTVSQFSADDIATSFNISPDKIDVVYNGAADEFYPDRGNSGDIIPDLEPDTPYFLFVSNISPRKNLPNMIRAFNICRDSGSPNAKLVIAGERFFLNSETDRLVRESDYRADIIFTGCLGRDQLRRLYSNAMALLFVPWFEGFGIPVVEAMKCGTPVITSTETSLPEISGNAALLCNPADPAGIASAMIRVASDPELAADLSEKGFKNADRFTWDAAALAFREAIEKVISKK
jgi:glycosyltransferase involved in cell wall biosynthesis